jgi:foldase protein PrsA
MRSARNSVGLILLVCVVLLGIALILSSAGGVADDEVADVDGAGAITKDDFNRWFAVVAAQPQPGQKKKAKPPAPGTKEYDAVQQQVMSFLVSSKWIEGEAKERGVSATDEEVQRQFKQVKDQSFPNEKAYQRLLKSSGQTEADLLYRVRLDVLANKVREKITAGSTDVSDADAEDYYNENKSQFEQPERRDVEVIKTKTQAQAQEALDRVKDGERWKKVAKDLSIDPASSNQDGRLIAVSKGQQEGAFDAALFSAVKNKLAGPVKSGSGYYVFRVTKVTPGTKQTYAQSKQGIKQLLASQNQQKKLDAFSTNFRTEWRANTDCATEYVIPDCRNGRPPTPEAPAPTGKQPVKGSSGAAPPARGGTGAPLVGVNPGGTVIGQQSTTGLAGGGLGGLGAAAGPTQSAPLALGGAPQEGAGLGAPGAIPGGAIPQQQQQVPVPGQ